MAKVHPNAVVASEPVVATPAPASAAGEGEPPAPTTVLTVWRKSLLFNCDGFTVFDARSGDLAFRVDSYSAASPSRRRAAADVVLMDAAGKPLLTVRRKTRLAGAGPQSWLIYDGDAADTKSTPPPLLSVRRHAAGKTLARVSTPAAEASPAAEYVVEGSYGQRACVVRDAGGGDGAVVAEVQRKEAIVGDDVFRLVVAGGRGTTSLGAPLAMALVIALDDMFRAGEGGGWAAMLRRTLSSA